MPPLTGGEREITLYLYVRGGGQWGILKTHSFPRPRECREEGICMPARAGEQGLGENLAPARGGASRRCDCVSADLIFPASSAVVRRKAGKQRAILPAEEGWPHQISELQSSERDRCKSGNKNPQIIEMGVPEDWEGFSKIIIQVLYIHCRKVTWYREAKK